MTAPGHVIARGLLPGEALSPAAAAAATPNTCWEHGEPSNARNSGYMAATELSPELVKTVFRALQPEIGPGARFHHFCSFSEKVRFSSQKVRFPRENPRTPGAAVARSCGPPELRHPVPIFQI